jgi:hypothetical protein
MCPLVYIFPSCQSMTITWKTTFENLFPLHIFPKPPQSTNVAKLIPCLLFGMEGELGGGAFVGFSIRVAGCTALHMIHAPTG